MPSTLSLPYSSTYRHLYVTYESHPWKWIAEDRFIHAPGILFLYNKVDGTKRGLIWLTSYLP